MTSDDTRGVTLTQPRADLPSASEFEVMQRMSKMFSDSGLYKNVANVAQAIAVVQTGRELGIGPSMALREMYIIPGQGRPTLSAALLTALVQRDHGDNAIKIVESTNDLCRVQYKRRSWPSPVDLTFSLEDAHRAGLGKRGSRNPDEPSNWEKYPRAMLRSRAISEACRSAFQDSIMGLYSVEELAPESVTVTPEGELVYQPSTGGADVIEGERIVQTASGRIVDTATGEIIEQASPALAAPAQSSDRSLLDPPNVLPLAERLAGRIHAADTLDGLKVAWDAVSASYKNGDIEPTDFTALTALKDTRKSAIIAGQRTPEQDRVARATAADTLFDVYALVQEFENAGLPDEEAESLLGLLQEKAQALSASAPIRDEATIGGALAGVEV